MEVILILGALIGLLLLRVPVAFALGALGIVLLWAKGLPMIAIPQRLFGTMDSFELLAVPLFLLMSNVLLKGGVGRDLFASVQAWVGHWPGGLGVATIKSCTLFSAISGSSVATAATIGTVAIPEMTKRGYDQPFILGQLAAGGTLGILIPPSIMLVVMGPVMEVPVTDLFAAAIIPGIMLAFMYMAYALIRCWLNPALGPALAMEDRAENMGVIWREFLLGLVPPAALVAFALGSILFGLATPTEGAGCGALGAMLLTLAYRKMTRKKLFDALVKTLEISALILFLVAASNFFGAVFSRLGTPTMLTEFLLDLELNRYVILFIIMALIFLLGWPLEWVPIVLIIVPILIPLVEKLGFNLTWFGILVAVNLQTAWLSPPVALSAYFLKGVVPEWPLKDIYLGMMQFMGIQLLGLILIIIFPAIALWLPEYIYGN